MNHYCFQRIRIQLPEKNGELSALATNWLPSVYCIIRAERQNNRVLVIYDNRKIRAWQILQIADLGLSSMATLTAKEEHFLKRTRVNYTLPAVMLAGLSAKRLLMGRSKLAQNLVIFQLATLVSVFSGYPELRRHIQRLAYRLETTDDRLLASLALGIAVLRESTTVFFVLMLLNYNAHYKHRQTLVAIAEAGEDIAAYDKENRAPETVGAYEAKMTKLAFLAAGLTAFFTRDPLRTNAVLLALNPRIGALTSKYAMNQAEIIAHENCHFIPVTSGEKLYDFAKDHSSQKNSADEALQATMALSQQLQHRVASNLKTATGIQLLLTIAALFKETAGAVNRMSDAAIIAMLLFFNHKNKLVPTDKKN